MNTQDQRQQQQPIKRKRTAADNEALRKEIVTPALQRINAELYGLYSAIVDSVELDEYDRRQLEGVLLNNSITGSISEGIKDALLY